MTVKTFKYILWFREISYQDVPLVGGKNASLGEMIEVLSKKGINIPSGFALNTKAYWYFLKFNKLDQKLKEIFEKFNPKSLKSLQETGKISRNLILKAEFPKDLKDEIVKAYQELAKEYNQKNIDVAVRSSGVAEDAPSMSFAGMFETYLNISGEKNLLEAIKKCLASAFNDRVISYREEKNVPHLRFALSVGIQKMIRSDLSSSGIIFTLDTETGFQNIVLINSIFGVGEMIVKGKVTPDEFYVFKPALKQGFKSIIVKNLGRKVKKYIYRKEGGLKEVSVLKKDQLKFSLTDDEILTLAKWACLIEEHYKIPQDIEWAKDGKSGKLFIVQSRPETVHAPKETKFYEEYEIKTKERPILSGIAIGNKIGQGKVKIIPNISKISQFQKGEVLVTKMTDPDWVSVFPLASAIVTDEGGKTCFSGDTKILTNQGFLTIEKIIEKFKKEEIKVLSLNKNTLKLEWKKVVNGFQRKAPLIQINISQTRKMENNILKVTPDHKFLTFHNRELISKKIQDLLKDKEYILSVQKIPSISNRESYLTPKLSYFFGGILTDGHIHLSRTHGEVQFIQKETPKKIKFIEKMKKCLKDLFDYSFHCSGESISEGTIRGKPIKGKASRYHCYSKKIATYFKEKQSKLLEELLFTSEENLYNLLAGIIDGDGTYNQKENRINIFCSNEELLKAINIICLRLGTSFQITKNRTIFNVQIVDNIEKILEYTSRVKGRYQRIKFGTRFFGAKQLLEDIIEKVNYKGRIRLYVKNNLLIDSEKIRNYIIPLIKGYSLNHELTKIINSSLRMLRVKFKKFLGIKSVYNIEVEDNRNFIVFTNRYTPVAVLNCHASIVSRELGVPCIVGTKTATKTLKNGKDITVDCTSGEGRIFTGKLPFKIRRYDLKEIPKLPTKIMVNIGAPEIAFKASFLPNEGVGLARIEFILAEKVRVHPLALYHYQKLKIRAKKDEKIKQFVKKIEEITIEHKDKKEHFIKELTEGIAQIASAFYPKPVIVRLSDLKTNEYQALVGGELFEPEEANPMLGWRGASRYYDEKFKPAFEMECQAIKRAREVFGLKNIWAMIPFCRTPEEGKRVLELMQKNGLEKGKDDLKVIVMCEIPSNVVLADKFLEIFDGMSIGSNDLTQLALGLDRDSALVAKIGDERNEAVKKMISKVIQECKKRKKYCGICGQAPSDYLEFTEFLIKEGIESISLNPDTVIKTILNLTKSSKKIF